jgi:D-alanyl-D-alanine carboxypeptidase (penicillin-binding protein 5/6)
MTTHRYAERALALSLALTAAGVFCVAGPGSATAAPLRLNQPIGGQQLAAPGVIVNLKPGVPAPPPMPGASFLLADMTTGQILVAKAPHAAHFPASTLKTLTALTLIPILNSEAKITVKAQDVNVPGTHVGILPGTTYSVGTLLQGMLIMSGNDAAYALARGNHDVATTLKAMNATAASLGAVDTVAKDPSGLDAVGQKSSAYDLALIGRAAMKLPDFRRVVGTKRAILSGGRSMDGRNRPGFPIANHNKLLFNYQGAIGIKNGFTRAAKYSYVEAATRGGKTYLLTEMASHTSNWRPTAALLNWAFAYGPSVTPIGDLVEPGQRTEPAQGPVASPPAVTSPTPAATQSHPATEPHPTAAAAGSLPALTSSSREAAHQPALPGWVKGTAAGAGGLALVIVGFRRRAIRKRR